MLQICNQDAADTSTMANPQDDNYLENFSAKELIEVVLNPSEWHASDVKEAKKILKQKGVTQKHIEEYRQRQEESLVKGERANMGVLALGFIAALFGGLVGILIGYYLANSKKEGLKGEKVFTYDAPSRKFGWIILALGVTGGIVWIILYTSR